MWGGWQILAFCAPFYFSPTIWIILEPGRDYSIYRMTVAMCQLVETYNAYMGLAIAKCTAAMSYLSYVRLNSSIISDSFIHFSVNSSLVGSQISGNACSRNTTVCLVVIESDTYVYCEQALYRLMQWKAALNVCLFIYNVQPCEFNVALNVTVNCELRMKIWWTK